ncbi:oxidoreductase [Kineococcus rhizosphaerae]|uniref:Aryl-alcohol dehydrogenase-like predicted oxidoreductase n=1 Tax=Kineococcus rhizosphaerae TaxID=559628 RepID=A0A2T0QZS2_9ACTN|nr:oxidoreductase [Kineococcus rhizosphaerae]PRY12187.1 aryl-alcohol dehydrogenase-like predicted oxidoreductase [Kineococcus rhizosphaerae]
MNDTYPVADLDLTRTGFGAMQLAGPNVFGPPRDRSEALAVLRTLVDVGVNHVDTADFYGPHVVNELIREAFTPADGVHVVTKVGAVRDEHGAWVPQTAPHHLVEQVHANLRTLGVDALEVVNLRVGGGADGHTAVPGSIAEQFGALADLQRQGLVRHLGLSTVDVDQLHEARSIAPVVCVQNSYNLAHREDEAVLRATQELGIAYVPYFPLGGFSPLQSRTLTDVATRLGASPLAVALAWLLQRSPNVLLIPGTSSVTHLRENVAGAALDLPADAVAELDAL